MDRRGWGRREPQLLRLAGSLNRQAGLQAECPQTEVRILPPQLLTRTQDVLPQFAKIRNPTSSPASAAAPLTLLVARKDAHRSHGPHKGELERSYTG